MRIGWIHGPEPAGGVEVTLHPQLTVVRGLTDPARAWLVDAVGRIDPVGPIDGRGELESAGILLPFDAASLELLGVREVVDCVVTPQHLGVAGPPPAADQAGGAHWFRDEDVDGHQPLPVDAGADLVAVEALASAASRPDPTRPDQGVGASPIARRVAALDGRRVELARLAEGLALADLGPVRAALDALDAAPTGEPRAGAPELADAWHDLQKDLKGLDIGTTAEERVAIAAVERAQDAMADAEAVLRQPKLTDDQVSRIEAAHAEYLDASDKLERRFGGGRARKQVAEAEAEELRLLERFGFESWVDYMLNTSKRAADPDMTEERATLEAAQLELEVCLAELDAIPGAVGRRRRRARIRERQDELSDRVAEMLGRQPVGEGVEEELRALTVPVDITAAVAVLANALDAVGVEAPRGRRDPEQVAEAARRLLASESHAEKRRSEFAVAIEALDEALALLQAAMAEGATEIPPMPELPDMAEPPVRWLDSAAGERNDASDQLALEIGLDPVPAPVVPPADDRADHADEPEPDPDEEVAGIEKLFDPDALHQQRPIEPGPASTGPASTGPASTGPASTGPDRAEATVAGEADEADAADRFVPHDLADRAGLVDDIHWELMLLIARARVDGPAGQLPVVFDDPFGLLDPDECLELLGRLVRLTDHVQLVVVSDRSEVAEWAGAIGPEHARVVG